MKHFQVAIIGGGPAGLTAAVHLSRRGLKVILFEKNEYPIHKVCGEYLSNEVLPYLRSLDIDLEALKPKKLNRLQFSTISGKRLDTELPLGGLGISRYCLDHFLCQKARENGVQIEVSTVENCEFKSNSFSIKTTGGQFFESEIAIGSYGKRSNLDKQLNRKFIQNKSQWLAVKAHFENHEFPNDLVALHNFDGGYCGLSKTETGAVNFCYLASYENFRHHTGIDDFNKKVVSKNKYLNEFLEVSKPLFDKPLSIAQISFRQKKPVEQHIIMCGDAAGLIHPLCGNGMAMAIHSAKIASERIFIYFGPENRNRKYLETDYTTLWKKTFKNRLSAGNNLQSLLLHPKLSNNLVSIFAKNPSWIKKIIQKTHGKPF